jgi:UDP-xylose/UDP-N-acetylglucosamine transporter B4
VPITQWMLQVTTFASGTLLNNLVYAYHVPPALQIVFRSAGKWATIALSRTFPRPFPGSRYSHAELKLGV